VATISNGPGHLLGQPGKQFEDCFFLRNWCIIERIKDYKITYACIWLKSRKLCWAHV